MSSLSRNKFTSFYSKRTIDDSKKLTEKDVDDYLAREKAVRAWIEAVLRIPKLDDDLNKALVNGIVLCYLAQEIIPRSIPTIQEATSSKHRLHENVYFFIAALEEAGVAPRFMFRATDLLDNECMPRVVFCLEEYARISSSKGFAVALRPPKEFPCAGSAAKMAPEQLEKLKLQILTGKPPEIKTRTGTMKVSMAVIRTQLAIYAGGENRIKMDRVERGFTKVQALWRGHRARKLFKRRVRDVAYRKNVAEELLQTEQDFVDNLDVCIRVFKKPLEEWSKEKGAVATPEEIASIFSDIEIIYQFNTKLLAELSPIVKGFALRTCLAKAFSSMIGFLPLYTNFVVHYDTSILQLNSLRKKEKFEIFLGTCRKNPVNVKHLDLSGYLIQPIQRVPRYLLLLNELVKHTWPEHPDFTGLREAAEKVQRLASMLNEKKREGENMMEMIRIKDLMTKTPKDFVLIEPSRKLLREGKFKVKGKKDASLFLFTDIVLYATGSDRLKFGEVMLISECELLSLENPCLLEVRKLGNKKATAVLTAESETARSDFIKACADALQTAKEKAKQKTEFLEKQRQQLSTTPAASAPEKTAEELLRDRKIRKKADQASEKLADMRAKKELLAAQITDLNATIAAAEKKKEKETAARAREVLKHVQGELKEVEDRILAAAQSDGETSPQSAPVPTPTAVSPLGLRVKTPVPAAAHPPPATHVVTIPTTPSQAKAMAASEAKEAHGTPAHETMSATRELRSYSASSPPAASKLPSMLRSAELPAAAPPQSAKTASSSPESHGDADHRPALSRTKRSLRLGEEVADSPKDREFVRTPIKSSTLRPGHVSALLSGAEKSAALGRGDLTASTGAPIEIRRRSGSAGRGSPMKSGSPEPPAKSAFPSSPLTRSPYSRIGDASSAPTTPLAGPASATPPPGPVSTSQPSAPSPLKTSTPSMTTPVLLVASAAATQPDKK